MSENVTVVKFTTIDFNLEGDILISVRVTTGHDGGIFWVDTAVANTDF